MEAPAVVTSPPRFTASPAWAYADGGPLVIAESWPRTLTAALLRTAREVPAKGIHFAGAERERFCSYSSLLANAARICSGLRANGLRAGDRIVLQLDDLEMHYTAFWGCVLTGVVPVTVAIPPTYRERNGVLDKLQNTWRLLDCPPILTSQRLRGALEAQAADALKSLRVLGVEELAGNPAAETFHEPAPTDVVFFQLSSGSTGVPKCIQETHQAVIAHIHASKEFNGYTADDITLNWLPVDHVVPLLTFHLKDVYLGCEQVHVPVERVLSEPLLWLDLLEAHRATHTWAPNFGFKLVSDRLARASGKPRDLSRVKYFMNAGEQVTLPVVRDFLTALKPFGVPENAMQPAFGMAEVCTCMTYANHFSLASATRRPTDAPAGTEFVSLGKVTPGTAIRIADADNHLLPEGVSGRLQIKGASLMPGYFHNDAANREAFVGDGWFNTGDLGFIQDGELFVTGREKEIIVIRGAKFYCHEVEDVVNGIPGVEPTFAAACGIADGGSGTETLAVFFSPAGVTDESSVVQAVRRRITERLGIAPAFVVPLTAGNFPKTTSGKIQRMRLKQSLEAGAFREVLDRLETHEATEAPKSAIESGVAEIWRAVLGVRAVGAESNLFQLGGDSLKAAQIVSRIRDRWQVELPLPLLFAGAATVKGMAHWIEENRDRASDAPPAIQPGSRSRHLPLSFAQLRLWLGEQIEPGTSLYHVCRTLSLKGPLDHSALENALSEIVHRHEILRTSYHFDDAPEQEVQPDMPLVLPRHDLSHLAEPEQRRIATNLIDLDLARPFDLSIGPLLRAKLIRFGAEDHLLVLVFHQIVTDGWSLGVFFRDLAALYAAAIRGQRHDLPPLPVQYADYAVWQQRWFSDPALEPSLEFWRRRLSPPLPALPQLGSTNQTADAGEVLSLVITDPLLKKIRAFSASENATLHMTLLAAFQLLLFRATGRTELMIGSPESGRHRLELESLLGCFVNMLPLRASLSPGDSFRTLVARVRESVLQAVAHADVPFEKMFQVIPTDGSAERRRLFDVWFGPIDSLQPFMLGEVQATLRPVFPPTAQFALSCFIAERPDAATCFFEWRKSALSGEHAERMLLDYEDLLARLLGAPDQPVVEFWK